MMRDERLVFVLSVVFVITVSLLSIFYLSYRILHY